MPKCGRHLVHSHIASHQYWHALLARFQNFKHAPRSCQYSFGSEEQDRVTLVNAVREEFSQICDAVSIYPLHRLVLYLLNVPPHYN